MDHTVTHEQQDQGTVCRRSPTAPTRDMLKFLQQPMETILTYSLASKQIWLDAVQAVQSH